MHTGNGVELNFTKMTWEIPAKVKILNLLIIIDEGILV